MGISSDEGEGGEGEGEEDVEDEELTPFERIYLPSTPVIAQPEPVRPTRIEPHTRRSSTHTTTTTNYSCGT